MASLGINIGSTSVKVALVQNGICEWQEVVPHEGNVADTLVSILSRHSIAQGTLAMATGNEGRHMVNLPSAIESLCIEEALRRSVAGSSANAAMPGGNGDENELPVVAVVSMGGEDLVVYTIDEAGSILTSFSGNKCAAGTGEFFRQQLARMDMTLADVTSVSKDSRVLKLSTRCSVFMKGDCTHRLNKGEATRGDIVVSLANVMAIKVVDFLKRARVSSGRVLLTGGVTRNPFILPLIQEKLPEVRFAVPQQAPYFEALGAAYLAEKAGKPLPDASALLRGNEVRFDRFENLNSASSLVTFLPSRLGKPRVGATYMMGVDGGSTTTKIALIDVETNEIAAAHYGRTHGDPVAALKLCIKEVQKQLAEAGVGESDITIRLSATTGSSREILGVFLETPAVYNEIIAHSVGTTFFQPDIDTLFEIGGQDAKYVYLRNKVPIDYAMNEACSAGTGSFLEESAQGDLNIAHAWEIADIALAAHNPLKFGQHCSAFINSDIRKAIQQGATREDITAGLVTSIVSNYINRVVGNRTIGNHIVLQGGVAKNRAIPYAFALLLGKPILVPPDPELMGCFGVGLLAWQKVQEGLLEERQVNLTKLLETDITYEKEFKCQACDNYCGIRVLKVNGNRYMFGGRCAKYTVIRKKNRKIEEGIDWVERRNKLLFETCCPAPDTFVQRRHYLVGVPRSFSIYSFWPFYSWFFHTLGVRTVFSKQVDPAGIARVESGYCFPAEIAHGAVQDLVEQNVDFFFLPHFRDLESYESDVHACFCPITQGLPYYLKKAFPDILPSCILSPVVSFKYGRQRALDEFIELGSKLGFTSQESEAAFDAACRHQAEYQQMAKELGREALAAARSARVPAITLLGRSYNAFATEANMGIPRKFTSNGHSIIPFDILPLDDAAADLRGGTNGNGGSGIGGALSSGGNGSGGNGAQEGENPFNNMYWYFGQQDMRAAQFIKKEGNIYATYISNFSCAPDSFILHYLRWIMGSKPFLVLELDSHTADAGVDTRVEAFLDIIEGYRLKALGADSKRYDNGLRFVNDAQGLGIVNVETGVRTEVKNNPRVKLLLSNMGRLAAEALAASLRGAGWNALAMPVPDGRTLQFARQHVSGKECLPSHLVLGSALQYLASPEYRKEDLYLLFVPETTGPCRTGQYAVFYRNLFRDLRLDNVVVMVLGSDNSYNELGPSFSRKAWWGLVLSDYLKDVEGTLRTCAADPRKAMVRFNELWTQLIEAAGKDVTEIIPHLEVFAREIKQIPLRRNPADCPKVLIVGEIYVRRDDFAVDELVELFSRKGIIPKISGVGEWIYYCDFAREYELKKQLSYIPFPRRYISKQARELAAWHVEQQYKHWVERSIKKVLAPTGLLIETPHDMRHILKLAEQKFVSQELESEVTISSGVSAAAMSDGYSGIVNISPFACLIGRVIEGVLAPWSRDERYPLISVEIDGNLLPPTTLSKLEIFMLNVLRFHREPGLDSLVDVERKTGEPARPGGLVLSLPGGGAANKQNQ